MGEEQEPPNRMAPYILRRLLWLPVILLIVSFVTFVLGRYGPGDPVQVLMGQHSNPAVVERIREQRGLNDPIVVQYVRYLRNVTRGDFGESFKYRGSTVNELLGNKMWVSVQLNITALIISFGLGVPIGLFAALRQRSLWDTLAISATLFGQSVPIFLTAPGAAPDFCPVAGLAAHPRLGRGLRHPCYSARLSHGHPRGCDHSPPHPRQHAGSYRQRLYSHGPRQRIAGIGWCSGGTSCATP